MTIEDMVKAGVELKCPLVIQALNSKSETETTETLGTIESVEELYPSRDVWTMNMMVNYDVKKIKPSIKDGKSILIIDVVKNF